jgi:methyl-accepting chemotaxis protein
MSEEDNSEKKLVGVRIEEDRHAEWKEYVDESNEFSSIAQMIRVGVSSVMSENDDNAELIEDLADDINRLHRDIKKTREAVEDLPMQIDDAEDTAEEVIYRLDELRDNDVTNHDYKDAN